MDLRVLVLVADTRFGEMVTAQVDNLGCATSFASTYDEGSTALSWAEAAIVDLTGDGLDDLYRMRIEAPTVRILAIAPDEDHADRARSAGVHNALVEPFSILDIGAAVRELAGTHNGSVVDLRSDPATMAEPVDAQWWATK